MSVSPIRAQHVLRNRTPDQRLRQTSAECADVERTRQSRRWATMRDLVLDAKPHTQRPSDADYAVFAWMFFAAVWLSTGFFFGYSTVTLIGIAAGLS